MKVVGGREEEVDTSNLHVFYCLCGEYVLILDVPLYRLPQRQTDLAHVLDTNKHSSNHNVESDHQPIFLRRPGGYEKQYRMRCKRCSLLVMYKANKGSPYLYIVEGALHRSQQEAAGFLKMDDEEEEEGEGKKGKEEKKESEEEEKEGLLDSSTNNKTGQNFEGEKQKRRKVDE
eukprot:Lithocolla_globosa_v1_NODE_4781_length_1367_cov_12.974085.p1 type:complete len:174 gc:universal NODE_4781_length_1367_cov_12.974085:724-203(-)